MALSDVILSLSPIDYWKLDEASGTTATDYGSNNLPLTYTGTPSFRQKSLVIDGATVEFNGSTQYASRTGSTALSPANISMFLWVNSDVTSTRQTVLARDNGSSPRAFFFGIFTDNKLELIATGSTGPHYSTSAIPGDGKLHMIGVTWSSSGVLSFYIDGYLDRVITGVAAPSTSSTEDLYVGRHNSGSTYVNGGMGHVAFFNYVLTAEQIRTVWRASRSNYDSIIIRDNPVLYLPLRDAGGTVATAIQGADGTYNNTPTLGVAGPTNIGSFGTTFDGTNEDVSTPADTTLPNQESCSLECWFKYTSTSSTLTIASLRAAAANTEEITILANFTTVGSISLYQAGAERVTDTGTGLNDGNWHHVVATVDLAGTTGRLYIDGVLANSGTTTTATSATKFLTIASNNAIQFFPGSVAAVSVYDYALTANQVYSHYVAAQREVARGLRAGAVLYLPLSDVGGTTAYAEVGQNGTYSGGPTLRVAGPSEVLAYGISTDGTDDVAISPTLTLGSGQAQTFEIWANNSVDLTSSSSFKSIIDQASTATTGIGFGNGGAGLSEVVGVWNYGQGTSDVTVWTGFTVTAGWHHHVFTYSGTQHGWIYYLDGVATGTKTGNSGGAFGFGATPSFRLATWNNTTFQAWAGIASFAVYNRALTADEVRSLWVDSYLWPGSDSPLVMG